MVSGIPKKFFYFLAALLAINIIQSNFTELIFDEAYYWYYSQNMAWGYFDHPPMVALLIKLSSFFFKGELGVRFMSCLLGLGTLLVLWLSVDHPKKNASIPQFFVLVFSMTLMNAYGFLTLPDTPLLFFTALFLLVYKKFIASATLPITLLLGVVMAALMYSKYHAVLVIVFVLLSNIKIIKNKYAWLAVGIALLCYSPHLYWLFEHDFVSIKYHIYERPNGAYNFSKYTLGFFVNLIAVFGFTFPLVYYILAKTKAKNLFTKALLFLTYGVLIFFFVSSFNRRIQTQWVILICIPLAIIVFDYMLSNKNSMKWIFRLGLLNSIIILYLRFGLVYQPLLFNKFYETHGNKNWVQQIKNKVGSTPVVFENSYRNAPMYAFYSGETSFSLNNVYYRKNQYSIDQSEDRFRHKKVLFVHKLRKEGTFHYTKTDGGVYYADFIDDFKPYRKLETELLTFNKSKDLSQLAVYNPYTDSIPMRNLNFAVAYLDRYKKVKQLTSIPITTLNKKTSFLIPKDTTLLQLPKLPLPNLNIAYVRIVISENKLYFGLNGKPKPLNK